MMLSTFDRLYRRIDLYFRCTIVRLSLHYWLMIAAFSFQLAYVEYRLHVGKYHTYEGYVDVSM
jgi:hypothetical protein